MREIFAGTNTGKKIVKEIMDNVKKELKEDEFNEAITELNTYEDKDYFTLDEIMFGDKIVQYENFELDQLVLAYATTVHKSQGSEFDAVVIPIFTQHYTLLQRNLLYTAITRAKKLCVLIGQTKAIAMAIANNKNFKRITFLKSMLKS